MSKLKIEVFLFFSLQLCADSDIPFNFHKYSQEHSISRTKTCVVGTNFSQCFQSSLGTHPHQESGMLYRNSRKLGIHHSKLNGCLFLTRMQVLRVRGGRIKSRQRLDDENERVAGLALKKLKQHPFLRFSDVNTSQMISKTDRSEIQQDDLLEAESRRRSSVNARSLLWNLIQRTALCIVLPDEYWPKIQKVRLEYDGWVNRWFHPVIVLFNPFFPVELLGEAAEAMQSCLRYFPAMSLRMQEIVVCTHTASFSLRLIPDAESLTRLEGLRDKLVALFPTLVREGTNPFRGNSAPHLMLGQFSSNRDAETVAENLRADGTLPIEFTVEELVVMAREEEPDGRENRASGRAPFDCLRSVVLGMGADTVEPGPISEAEANLDVSDEPPAIVQEWNPTAGRFQNVRGDEFEILEKKKNETLREERRKRAEKMEDKARDFFKEPNRQAEAQRAAIPASLVANVSAALHLGRDVAGGDGSVLTSFVREYRRRHGVSLTRLAADLGFGGVSQLLRAMPDVVRLSRRRADVFVHRVVPHEEKERVWRGSALKKELAAMKGRDSTEMSAARGTNRRIRAAESRVMQRFARRVGAADAALVEEYGYRLVDEARAAKFGPLRRDPDSPYYDPEAAKFAADLDDSRSGDSSGSGRAGSNREGTSRKEAGWGAGVNKAAGSRKHGGNRDNGVETENEGEKGDSGEEVDDAGRDSGRYDGGGGMEDAVGDSESAVGSDSEAATRAVESALQKRLLRRHEKKS